MERGVTGARAGSLPQNPTPPQNPGLLKLHSDQAGQLKVSSESFLGDHEVFKNVNWRLILAKVQAISFEPVSPLTMQESNTAYTSVESELVPMSCKPVAF
jgi:hypothetical protein